MLTLFQNYFILFINS